MSDKFSTRRIAKVMKWIFLSAITSVLVGSFVMGVVTGFFKTLKYAGSVEAGVLMGFFVFGIVTFTGILWWKWERVQGLALGVATFIGLSWWAGVKVQVLLPGVVALAGLLWWKWRQA